MTGIIPGSSRSKEEILLLGHLYEPGATDNAGGCGVRIEIARVLNKLIKEKKLPLPHRTIRFLFGYERYGTAYYCTRYPDKYKKVIASFELDCCGDDHIKCRNPLGVKFNYLAQQTYINALVTDMLERYILGKRGHFFTWWKVFNYQIWGPNISDADLASYANGAPAVMFGHANYYWHTSSDTMDKLSPTNLGYIGTIVATLAYFISRAKLKEALYLARISTAYGKKQIITAAQQTINSGIVDRNISEVDGYLAFVEKTMEKAVRSVSKLLTEKEATKANPFITEFCKQLQDTLQQTKSIMEKIKRPIDDKKKKRISSKIDLFKIIFPLSIFLFSFLFDKSGIISL